MLTKLEIVVLSAVIALAGATTLTATLQPSSMSLIYGKPSFARSLPASAFGGGGPFIREEDDSYDEMLAR